MQGGKRKGRTERDLLKKKRIRKRVKKKKKKRYNLTGKPSWEGGGGTAKRSQGGAQRRRFGGPYPFAKKVLMVKVVPVSSPKKGKTNARADQT